MVISLCRISITHSTTYFFIRLYILLHIPLDPLPFFFFQAEDGIRYGHVTGVQTCALPILRRSGGRVLVPRGIRRSGGPAVTMGRSIGARPGARVGGSPGGAGIRVLAARGRVRLVDPGAVEIGRASCRERG